MYSKTIKILIITLVCLLLASDSQLDQNSNAYQQNTAATNKSE